MCTLVDDPLSSHSGQRRSAQLPAVRQSEAHATSIAAFDNGQSIRSLCFRPEAGSTYATFADNADRPEERKAAGIRSLESRLFVRDSSSATGRCLSPEGDGSLPVV